MTEINGKKLEKELQNICKSYITIAKDEKRQYTVHFNKVYKYVTDLMGKRDSSFEKIFQRQQLAGSYADKIKVGKPNEYDALMILKIPDSIVAQSQPGYVTVNIKDALLKLSDTDKQKYLRLIDENGYFLQDKVLAWLRKLIYEIVIECNNLIIVDNTAYEVCKSSSGPAVTLKVTIKKSTDQALVGGQFSIDFVGAFAFNCKDKWLSHRTHPTVKSKHWNAIPKPSDAIKNNNQNWCCSYADIEREYLEGTQSLKQLIRIFKKIRDTNNLTNLKSYFIKLIFLHQRDKKSHTYWEQSLGVLFLEMFDVLLDHLKTKNLMSFWHKKYNLFNDLTTVQVTDLFNKLKKIKGKIVLNLQDNKPEFIRSIILPKL